MLSILLQSDIEVVNSGATNNFFVPHCQNLMIFSCVNGF
jgi:hypothetical protein